MNEQKQISEVIELWKTNKKQYVKKSSFSAYTLLVENHLLPAFGDKFSIEETEVQTFVFQKLEAGLSQKTIKDILIVLKMILKFGKHVERLHSARKQGRRIYNVCICKQCVCLYKHHLRCKTLVGEHPNP